MSTVPAQCTVQIIPETEPVEFFFWYDVSECTTSITAVDLNSDLTFLIQSGGRHAGATRLLDSGKRMEHGPYERATLEIWALA